jgi:hypothetical protein
MTTTPKTPKTHAITLTMRGYDTERDANVLKCLSEESMVRLDGTGFGLDRKERDVFFFSYSRPEAESIKSDIEKALRVTNTAGKVRILSLRGR